MIFKNEIYHHREKIVEFQLNDLDEWLLEKGKSLELIDSIKNNTLRYFEIIEECLDEIFAQIKMDNLLYNNAPEKDNGIIHGENVATTDEITSKEPVIIEKTLPKVLTRRLYVNLNHKNITHQLI